MALIQRDLETNSYTIKGNGTIKELILDAAMDRNLTPCEISNRCGGDPSHETMHEFFTDPERHLSSSNLNKVLHAVGLGILPVKMADSNGRPLWPEDRNP